MKKKTNRYKNTKAELKTIQVGGDWYSQNQPLFMNNQATQQNFNYPVPQNIEFTPQPLSLGNTPYQPTDYSQNFTQSNPLPSYSNNGFQYNPNVVDTSSIQYTQPQNINPLAADTGSGMQPQSTDNNYNKTQFFNAYSGFDIPSAAYKLGQGIETGNAFDITTSGLKLATGLGRNIASGMGQANRRENIMEDYYNTTRQDSRPMSQSLQNGGYMYTSPTPPREDYDQLRALAVTGSTVTSDIAPTQIPTRSDYDQLRAMAIQGSTLAPEIATQGVAPRSNYDQLRALSKRGSNVAIEKANLPTSQATYQNFRNPYIAPNNGLVSYQDGGQQDQGQVIMQQVAEALQSGADPQQILQSLVQRGIPQEEATALIQGVIQQMQAPQEQTMRDGGTSKKKVEEHPEYLQEGEVNNNNVVAEIESGEHVKTPNGQIKEAVGEKHANGGVKVTAEQLPDGSQIISDHLEVGKGGAKKFNNDYDLGIKSTDTYATVIDKFNRKSGIKKINDEQEIVLKNIEKQTKKLEETPSSASTIKLNLQLFTDQLAELEEQKTPLVEARKVLFDEVFAPQEKSKQTHNAEAVREPIPQEQMANGGVFNGDMVLEYSKKHNLHPDRVREIIQIHQSGGTQKNPLVQNSTLITDFPNTPTELSGLPYNPRETNPNQIWQGLNYENTWIPLVEESLANPEQAKKIDNWLTENKGTFSPNVQKQLEGLTGDARIQKIKTLATDKFPGLFHNAVLSAIEATTPINEEPVLTPSGYVASGARGQTKYVLPNLPDQSPLLPDSLQGALKMTHRYDRVETPLVSPDQAITEIRRQEQSAMEGLQNLPDAQKASAIAQIQANTQNALNQAIAQTTGANQQAKYNADVANAQIQMREEDMRNTDLQNYETKILKADANTQRDLRNYYNNAQKVNLTNYNYVQGLNLVNDRYDNAQFTGDGSEFVNLQKAQAYDSYLSKTPEQKKAEAEAEIKAKKKLESKSKKRFGGTK